MDTTTVSISVSLSKEVMELFADNGLDLFEELQKEVPNISKDNKLDPTVDEDNLSRDITLVILASSVAFYTISMGIEKIINAISNKPSKIKKQRLVPVTDPKGNLVLDRTGEPILHWIDEAEIVEPKKAVEEEGKSTITWLGLKVDLENKRKQM